MYTLDANIFIRDADVRDPENATCNALLEAIRTSQTALIEPLILLPEVAGALSRYFRDPLRGRLYVVIIQELPNVQFVAVDAPLAQAAADIAADYALRGMDAIYVATAQQHNTTLITLDAEVQQRGGAIVSVQTPREALAALQV